MADDGLGPVAGIVLAGGLSRRFGADDKCLALLDGKPLVEWVIARARTQVAVLAICADNGASRFGYTGLPVLEDAVPGFRGPLSAVLAGMEWGENACPGASWLATFPADGPFCPEDMVDRLLTGAGDSPVPVFAAEGAETHQAFALWPMNLKEALRRFLVEEGRGKILDFAEAHGGRPVRFSAPAGRSSFFNINTKEDLAAAARLVRG